MTGTDEVVERGRAGSRPVGPAVGRSAAGLLGLVLAGGVAGVLATPLAGGPGVAQGVGDAVRAVPGLLGIAREATGLGSPVAVAVVLVLVASALLLDGRRRRAVYVAVAGAGAPVLVAGTAAVLALGPPDPVAPDGHTLGAAVAYGVLVVVVAPAVPARWRRPAVAGVVVLVVLVGLTRLALGQALPEVVLGFLLGAGWVAVTTAAFGYHRPPPHRPEPAALGPAPRAGRRTAVLAGTWAGLLVLLLALGALVMAVPTVQRVDSAITAWFVALRAPVLTGLAQPASGLGDTPTVLAGALALAVLTAAATRSARPVGLVVLLLGGELALFLISATVVARPRPEVDNLGLLVPPTSSFPSGHVSAAVCLYGLAALLASTRLPPGRRWTPFAVAAVAVVAVGWGRLYYGVHHPTDVVASLLFAVPWLLACWRLGPPAAPPPSRGDPARGGHRPHDGNRHDGAGIGREAAG